MCPEYHNNTQWDPSKLNFLSPYIPAKQKADIQWSHRIRSRISLWKLLMGSIHQCCNKLWAIIRLEKIISQSKIKENYLLLMIYSFAIGKYTTYWDNLLESYSMNKKNILSPLTVMAKFQAIWNNSILTMSHT